MSKLLKVWSLAITNGYGGSGIDSNECHRFSNNIGATNDNYMFSFEGDIIGIEEFFYSFWSTGNESITVSEKEVAYIGSSKTINIFF